ncbi:MAG: TonB family protein [Candidatus Binataceae bacterium]
MDPRVKERAGLGYAGAIAISALAHAAFIYLVLFALPRWFVPETTPPPAYSVNIVDNIPAGDLGTHTLPPLSGGNPSEPEEPPEPEEKEHEPPKVEPPAPSTAIEAKNEDSNAFALNKPTATVEATPEPTATSTPTPEPTATAAETPAPTVAAALPTPEPTARPTPRPWPIARRSHRPRPTARPTPRPRRLVEPRGKLHRRGASPKATPNVMFAHKAPPNATRNISVKERLREVREELLKEHLQQLAAKARNNAEPGPGDSDDERASAKGARSGTSGGGPVLGSSASPGKGYGIGSGTGSLGMLKDPEFVLYYQKVQDRIKKAWSFYGGNKNLTTTVEFAIGPDGKVAGISIKQSSNNAAFDQSVVRAVRLAAPFPPPPEKFRDQFAGGVQAMFKLGELSS